MPKPILRSDVLEIKDLTPGMILKGTVRNVIDFGAFVDIGVHQDGLVHISALSNTFVKDPREVVKTGQLVKVKVMEVDVARARIGLSMRLDDEPGAASNQRASNHSTEKRSNQTNRSSNHNRNERSSSGQTAMAAAFAKLK